MTLKKIRFLILILVLAISCKEDEVQYTGNLIVTDSAKRDEAIGLFDIGVLYDGKTWPKYALEVKETHNGSAEFLDLNPGNYAVGFIYSDDSKVVQVKIGQTTTIDLFE